MKLVIMVLLAIAAHAQSTLTLTGPANVKAGSAATLTVSATGATATGPAGLQWSLPVPSGWSLSSPAGAQTGRTYVCGTTNPIICLSYSAAAATPHTSGQVGTIQLAIPATAAPGPYTMNLSNVVAASVTGTAHPVTVGTPYTIRVLHRADLTGNGTVDLQDVQLMTQQALGAVGCADDQNGDTKCDILDVLLVVLAAATGQ